MWATNFRSGLLTALCAAFISGHHSPSYDDLEVLGVSCPSKDSCVGNENALTSVDRNCTCDYNCTAYKDCCINAFSQRVLNSRPPPRTDVECFEYVDRHSWNSGEGTGVYVINNCSSRWDGPKEVRERCIGADDFSDPLTAAPVTDVAQKQTYRNLACAECSNANLTSLTIFVVKLICGELGEFTEEQIIENLTYSQQYGLWGVNRLNRFDNETEFVNCDVVYDAPVYLNNSVRFCRPNLVSSCAKDWTRPVMARLCAQYMAVVFSHTHTYRNIHCAICNYKSPDAVSCWGGNTFVRKRPMRIITFSMDVNQSDGYEVGMRKVPTPECTPGHKYDPFFKKCRQLECSLPLHNVVDGRCVKE